ncbi:MAG: hypothetical protein FJ207_09600 [Gemmatimonadetes bacterium]|nr:hypothetical protein [Gemmatimonadota bacterium]
MSPTPPRGVRAPAAMAGAAAAIAGEVAIGILLYASPGLMRSLTTLLAVEGLSFAAGLHTAPSGRADLVDRLRRRWLFCLGAFLVAAVYGTLWSLFESLGEARIGQGLGLALLAGMPLFACGTLLGGMSAMAESDTSGVFPKPGAAAAFGAGLGFVATGLLLPRAPIPASLLVGCLMLLSGGGMIYGSLVDERSEGGGETAAAGSVHTNPPPP